MYNGVGMYFEILGEITEIEVIATGHGIGALKFLRRRYGGGQWRKLKGIAKVRKRSAPCGGPRCTGMKPTALAEKAGRLSGSWTDDHES